MHSGDELPESRLEVVQIYFDTASFDEIERDKKIKFEAQLSLIGGTMVHGPLYWILYFQWS